MPCSRTTIAAWASTPPPSVTIAPTRLNTTDHAGVVTGQTSTSPGVTRAGVTAIGATVTMIVGAVLYRSSGTDLDAALDDGTVLAYLAEVADVSTIAVANLSVWLVGALLLGLAGVQLASLSDAPSPARRAAHSVYVAGAAIAVVAFVTWLGLVTQLAPAAEQVAEPVAALVGWIASRTDWVATTLLAGFGPPLIAYAGRHGWVPTWLARWSVATAAAGVLTAVAMFTGGLTTYGFLIVPVGLGWMIAAGTVALRTR